MRPRVAFFPDTTRDGRCADALKGAPAHRPSRRNQATSLGLLLRRSRGGPGLGAGLGPGVAHDQGGQDRGRENLDRADGEGGRHRGGEDVPGGPDQAGFIARLLPAAQQAAAEHDHLADSFATPSDTDPEEIRDAKFTYGLEVVLDGLAMRLPPR